MGHPARLARLTFPARNKPEPTAMSKVCDSVALPPKLRRNAVVDHIADHVCPLTVFDEPERIAAELKVVTTLVNAVRPMAFDVNPLLHADDQIIEGAGARF